MLREEAERRGLIPPPTFREFIEKQNPTLLQAEHVNQKLVSIGQRISDGEIPRTLIFAPPRYFKSEVFSRLLPAYFLRAHRSVTSAIITHSHTLSSNLSTSARDYFTESGGALATGESGKMHWETPERGAVWASGTDGRFLGKGFDLGVVDDPVDPQQVESLVYQRRFEEFWPRKFLSRQEPAARIVVVMQRLGTTDPADFLLRREVGERTPKAPEYWHVVVLDEIHSDAPLGRWSGPRGLPPTCTLEDDWREVGEILAPSRFTQPQVEMLRRSAGPVTTSTQRDQRPTEPEGDFWSLADFEVCTYDELPAEAYDGGKDWDTAYTEEEKNAASSWIESYRGPGDVGQFRIYIHDMDFAHKSFPDLVSWMGSLEGPHFIEAKASGKSSVQVLARYDVPAQEVQVKGSKLARASAAQPAVRNRRVWIRQEIFDKLLRHEVQGLLRVTAESLQADGRGLDVNDAFVQAIWRHLRLGEKNEEPKKTAWFT